jgi:hypothetical protein
MPTVGSENEADVSLGRKQHYEERGRSREGVRSFLFMFRLRYTKYTGMFSPKEYLSITRLSGAVRTDAGKMTVSSEP